mgnify:CR=1 FL=1
MFVVFLVWINHYFGFGNLFVFPCHWDVWLISLYWSKIGIVPAGALLVLLRLIHILHHYCIHPYNLTYATKITPLTYFIHIQEKKIRRGLILLSSSMPQDCWLPVLTQKLYFCSTSRVTMHKWKQFIVVKKKCVPSVCTSTRRPLQ